MLLNRPVANEEVGQHQISAFIFQASASVVFQSHKPSKELEAPVCSSSNCASVPSQRRLVGSQTRAGPKGLLPTGAGLLPAALPAPASACRTRSGWDSPSYTSNRSPGARVSVFSMIRPRMNPVFRQGCKAALFLFL